MSLIHEIKCPVCRIGNIQYDLQSLCKGVDFSCSSCQASFSLQNKDRNTVTAAHNKMLEISSARN